MSLHLSAGRRTPLVTRLRATVPVLLLVALAVTVWWAGPWLLPVAVFALACWRAPDPAAIGAAVELLAAGLVLILAAVAVLIGCVRGGGHAKPRAI